MNVVAAPLRSEKTKALRHNTKQGTSPLDASDVIDTNRFKFTEEQNGTQRNQQKQLEKIEDKEKELERTANIYMELSITKMTKL